MNCFCGCGKKVPGKLVEINLQAGKVAMELLAWDKARQNPGVVPHSSKNVDPLIERGADCYQRLILMLHGERDADTAESEVWLGDSLSARRGREDMTRKGSLLFAGRLNLTDQELQRLNRERPELTFSGEKLRTRSLNVGMAEQLERLGALHAEGVLTDEEFSAARARVLGRA